MSLPPTDPPASESSTKLVGALQAGLRILRYFSARQAPAGVNLVARELGLNPSTCFNLLRTLAHERLLEFDVGTKLYRPGLGLLELARGSLGSLPHGRLARPMLERLAETHHVTAMLWQRYGRDRVVLVDFAASDVAVRIHMAIGQRLPWSIGALGRCFLAKAGLSRSEIKTEFDALRWQNAPSFDEFVADVERARRDGYAIDYDHFVRGVTTVSSVVTDGLDTPVMAISAIAFSSALDEGAARALAADVADSAQRLSSGSLPATDAGASTASGTGKARSGRGDGNQHAG